MRNATLATAYCLDLDRGRRCLTISLIAALSALNLPLGVFRGHRTRIAIAAADTTRLDVIAIYAILGTYVIAVFVLYASFSTIINYFLILKFTKVEFTCSSDYPTFLVTSARSHGGRIWGVLMYIHFKRAMFINHKGITQFDFKIQLSLLMFS